MSRLGARFFVGIVVGIAFLIPTVTTYLDRIELVNSGLESTATVTSFRGIRSTARFDGRPLYVQYTVNGTVYNNLLNLKFANTYIGDEVIILYNPNNPNNITPKDRDRATDSIVFGGRFAIAVLVILLSVFDGRNHARKAKHDIVFLT